MKEAAQYNYITAANALRVRIMFYYDADNTLTHQVFTDK